MDSSGSAKTVSGSAYINTGISPATISATNSITLPAVTWQWTVSYNANGGSGATVSQNKIYGQTLTLSSTRPTRTGYTFLGWTIDPSPDIEYYPGGAYTNNSSASLYAVWQINTWTVSYNANGGSGAPSSQTKTYGVNLTLSSTIPTRTNYNFLGWSTSSTATSPQYSAGGVYTANQGATLYAVWELAYVEPKITNLSIFRCDSSGEVLIEGINAAISFGWECCQITGYNPVASITITLEGTETQIEASGSSGTVTNYVIGSDSLSVDSSYTITVKVVDTIGGSTVNTITLPTSAFPIDFKSGGNGVAFGKTATMDNTMETAFEVRSSYIDCGFRHVHPDTRTECAFGVSSWGGLHHGMWSNTANLRPIMNDGTYTHLRTNSGGGTIGTSEAPFQQIYDQSGTLIRNGLAMYGYDEQIDPDTTLDHLVLTNKNTPYSRFMYIKTEFYSSKTTTSHRIQTAYPYDKQLGIYYRYYYLGSWSSWSRINCGHTDLWNGTSVMGDGQVLSLADSIVNQASGIVLHWCFWTPSTGAVSHTDNYYTYVPKWHVLNRPGFGVQCSMTNTYWASTARKYVYINTTSITGYSMNTDGENNKWVLLGVLGV